MLKHVISFLLKDLSQIDQRNGSPTAYQLRKVREIHIDAWSVLRRCTFNVSLPSYKRNSPALADVTKNQTELSLGKRVINASFLVGRALSVSSRDVEQRRRSLTDTRINRLVST